MTTLPPEAQRLIEAARLDEDPSAERLSRNKRVLAATIAGGATAAVVTAASAHGAAVGSAAAGSAGAAASGTSAAIATGGLASKSIAAKVAVVALVSGGVGAGAVELTKPSRQPAPVVQSQEPRLPMPKPTKIVAPEEFAIVPESPHVESSPPAPHIEESRVEPVQAQKRAVAKVRKRSKRISASHQAKPALAVERELPATNNTEQSHEDFEDEWAEQENPVDKIIEEEQKIEESNPSSMGAELALTKRAQLALRRGKPAIALKWLSQAAEQHPTGVLKQERDALRILSLCALGQADRADIVRKRFLRTWPNSPWQQKVKNACE